MTYSTGSELQSAAESLVKWDKRRSQMTRLIRYDVSLDKLAEQVDSEEPQAWVFVDPRMILSLPVWSRVNRATDKFCNVAEVILGAERLDPQDFISPDRPAGGHPCDPLIKFPSGLIFRSVAAANHVLNEMNNVAPEAQNPLQTS